MLRNNSTPISSLTMYFMYFSPFMKPDLWNWAVFGRVCTTKRRLRDLWKSCNNFLDWVDFEVLAFSFSWVYYSRYSWKLTNKTVHYILNELKCKINDDFEKLNYSFDFATLPLYLNTKYVFSRVLETLLWAYFSIQNFCIFY